MQNLAVSKTLTKDSELFTQNSLVLAKLNHEKQAVLLASAKLEAVSPLATLARGYAIVRNQNGMVRSSVGELSIGDQIEIQLQDGTAEAEIKTIAKDCSSCHTPKFIVTTAAF